MSNPEVLNKNKLTTGHFKTAYETLRRERPDVAGELGGELSWLTRARSRDFKRWENEGLPTKKFEKWMYTSLAPLAESTIVVPSARVGTPSLQPRPFAGADSEIVFVNGRYSAKLSRLDPDQGVKLIVLSELLDRCVNEGWSAERVQNLTKFRQHVETSDADRETVFAAMNTSFLEDGILISIEKDTKVLQPIVITYLVDVDDAGAADLSMVSPRVFIHLDRGAEASFLETYEGRDGQRYFSNTVSDLRLEENARLSFVKLQLEGNEAYHVGTTRIHQARSSFVETFQFTFGAKLSRQDLHIDLGGEGAEVALDGLYMLAEQQHADNHTVVEHLVPQTLSSQIYKGVLDGRARAVFNGAVKIHRDAQQSNASQLNNNLMLSANSEVNTKPELEIDADDVKASHGATIGRIDSEHVFYLQTRGIPKEEALRLLALGFAQEVSFRIRNAKLREHVRRVVDARFALLKSGPAI